MLRIRPFAEIRPFGKFTGFLMKGCKVDTASKFEGHLGPRYIYTLYIYIYIYVHTMYVCTSYCMSVCNHPSKWVGMQHIIGIMTQIDNFFKICANNIILLYIFIEYIVHIYAYVRCDLRSFQTSYTKAIFPSKPGRLAWSINCQSVKVYLHYSNLSNLQKT